MPRILRDILVTILSAEPELEVISASLEAGSLAQAVNAASPDVVVTSLTEPDLPTVGNDLLSAHPHLMLFVVSADGRAAFKYKLHPHRVALGEASPATLLAAVRGARQEAVRYMTLESRDFNHA